MYFWKLEPDQPGTKHNKEYEVTPSAPPKLPLVASFPTATSHIPDTLCEIKTP